MKINYKSIMWWVVALVIMLSSYSYQKMTGPTYPKRASIELNGQNYKFQLPRTSDEDLYQLVDLEIPDKRISGEFHWKRYKSHDSVNLQQMERKGNLLIAKIPHQPPAGKVEYDIYLKSGEGQSVRLNTEKVVLRYKGKVPDYWMIPHIIFMFLGFWFAVRTGIEAVIKGDKLFKLTLWSTILLFWGGMVLGPIIQKYAFNAYWTGWPFGHDLTDNKTLAAFIMWVIALWRISKRPEQRWWAIIAAIVTLAVFIVPHSVLGSEIDYTKLPVK
jgi:hypothetical protein